MRVVICPDKFAGTLAAGAVAAAIAGGWFGARPADDLDLRPLSDGGPGFVDVLDAALAGKRIPVATVDPLGRPVRGEVLVVGETAYVESADACGLHLLAPDERDPKVTSTYGLGVLIAAAAGAAAEEIIVGLGGSATNDGGAGMLAALGAVPVDAAGRPLPRGGAALARCADIVGTLVIPPIRLAGATDVHNPLTGIFGASAMFGPQKGATREDVLALDAALERFAAVLSDGLPGCPADLAARPGAGAAGGLGAAILALGGDLRPGIAMVRSLTGLDAALDGADLVITGEGSVDIQSLHGKVVAGVAAAARDRGIPCVVLAGQSSTGQREAAAAGITHTYTLVDHYGGDLGRAMAEPAAGLGALGARLARQWSRTAE
ncbi:MAG TPA: glycerate kinase [Micromonosporaceae bacterium]|nr:glycerate kinase [Micromonosporaceae bacterium]